MGLQLPILESTVAMANNPERQIFVSCSRKIVCVRLKLLPGWLAGKIADRREILGKVFSKIREVNFADDDDDAYNDVYDEQQQTQSKRKKSNVLKSHCRLNVCFGSTTLCVF